MLKNKTCAIFIQLIFLSLFFFYGEGDAADTIKFRTEPDQKVEVPYRLFRTDNMWNQLLLDTRDGRLWQVAFGIGKDDLRAKIPINNQPLVSKELSKVGRFTLYPTDNMWTFLLVDQIGGRIWQCQFSIKIGQQFIIEVPLLKTK